MRTTVFAVALAMALFAGIAATALAQQPLTVDFQNGLVTVEATNVPARTILTEWERRGGTKVVGADRMSGSPLTLKLVNVTEAKALETILRGVAGYMAAPRAVIGAGPSVYDRILVMATTSAPAPPATARPGGNPTIGANPQPQRFMQRPPRVEEPEPDQEEEPDENPPNPPVFTFPQPGQVAQPGFGQPGQFNGGAGSQPGQNGITVNPANGGAPQGITINPVTTPGQPTTPGAAIGVSTPGMMVQPPQPRQPGFPPGGTIRPPGGQ
jgi:hypothetical protein